MFSAVKPGYNYRKFVTLIMVESTIFSIGHGQKKIEEFIAELKSFDIQFLLDIRSKPYSKLLLCVAKATELAPKLHPL